MQHAIHNIEQGHPQARLVLHRALLFFHQAVKALSQNRTIGGKFTMGRVCRKLSVWVKQSLQRSNADYPDHSSQLCEKAFTILVGLYTSIYQSTISTLTTTHTLPEVPDPSQPLDLDLSLSTLKILGKLIVYGWGGAGEDAHRKADFTQQQTQFFISSMRDFEAIFNVRKQIISNSVNAAALQQQAAMQASPLITLNKYILAYGKMYHALLLQNHIIFHDLGRTRTLVGTYWTFIEDASTNLQTANLGERPNGVRFPSAHYVLTCTSFQMILLLCTPLNSSCNTFSSSSSASPNFHMPIHVSIPKVRASLRIANIVKCASSLQRRRLRY